MSNVLQFVIEKRTNTEYGKMARGLFGNERKLEKRNWGNIYIFKFFQAHRDMDFTNDNFKPPQNTWKYKTIYYSLHKEYYF